jgi:predicted enzyme related to lactoylglutathione lyase
MLAFWKREAGAVFDHVLPIRRGVKQYRHDISGSVLKINNHYEPLPQRRPSGYSELLIARDDIAAERKLRDPDGNAVRLVPTGAYGITQVGIRLHVRNMATHRTFFTNALELNEVAEGIFRAGATLILLEQSANATGDASVDGIGWRYITFQVFKVDQEHARILDRGGQEAMKPTTLGDTARISMIRDPDGNWIEISQRASLVGSLAGT